MKSIIKELWHGNIMPPEDSRQNTPEMKQLLEYISRHNDDLQKKHDGRAEGDLREVSRLLERIRRTLG